MLSLVKGRRPKRGTWLRLESLEARTLLSPVAIVGSPTAPGPSGIDGTYVRKNQIDLTDKEKKAFVDAVKQLKTTYNPGSTVSVYDEFVQEHYDAFTAGHAHEGPAFLAWHREFLLRFEQALRQVDPKVTVPYWDFTVDNSASSSIWGADFLGGDGDPTDNHVVKTGPFRQGEWVLNVNGGDGTDLRRDFGGLVPTLPTADDVQAAFDASQYDVFPFDSGSPIDQSFRNNLEGFNHPTAEPELHNRVHAWVGGSMAIAYSPNDPLFWLLHANLDRLWAKWQGQNAPGYAPETGAAEGHNLRDLMSPFGVTPESVLDHRALGYRYDTEPPDGGSGGGGPGGVPRGSPVGAPPSPHGPHRGAPATSVALVQALLHGLHAGAPGDAASLAALVGSLGTSGEHGNQLGAGEMAVASGANVRLEGMASETASMSLAGTAGMERGGHV